MTARRPAWTGAAAALVVTVHVAEMAVFHFVYPGYAQEYAGVPTEWVTLHPRMEEVRTALGQTGGRVLAADGSRNWFLRPNLTRAWAVPAASGTGPLGPERYADLLRLGGPGDVSPEIFGGDNRATDLLSVRYALVPEQWPLISEQRLDGRRWELVERVVWDPADPASAYWLVRSRRALPPAWLVPRVAEVEPGQVLPTIHAGRFADGRTFAPEEVALIEPGAIAIPLHDAGAGTACGSVGLIRHEAAARAYLVETARPCVLVMSVVWHPWWRASIDGEGVDLVRVNHTLAGVVVPAGPSRVTLEIVPSSLHRGMLISAVAGLTWVVVLVIAVRGRRTTRVAISSARVT